MHTPTGENRKPSFKMLSLVEQRTLPRIVITKKAIKWMEALVDIHPLEVGWYGVVDERDDGSYLVRDILYPKHSEMESTTCEISPEGEADMMQLLFDEGREEDISKAKLFWGHSHHTMGTTPSPQDESQAMDIMKQTQNLCIRAICNKAGELSLSVFDYKNSVRFDNVPFETEDDNPEELEQFRIDTINTIVASNKTRAEKLKAIDLTMKSLPSSDEEETKQIRKWVTELKVENSPEPKSWHNKYVGHHAGTYSPTSKKNGNQGNMFPKHTRKDLEDIAGSRDPAFSGVNGGHFEDEVKDVLEEFDLFRQNGRFQ